MYTKSGTVLVVDDEPSVADLLYEDLTELGYECFKATTGEDALERLLKDDYDLMLLDLKLPGISGIDILKEVKSNHPGTKVIVVTALKDVQTAVEAMKAGAIDYITKPFDLEEINTSIEENFKTNNVNDTRLNLEEETPMIDEETGWTRFLNDISEGVCTWLDSLTGYIISLTVIEETVNIARDLKIPGNRIDEWADSRRKDIKRTKILERLMEKG